MNRPSEICLPALEIRQGDRCIYQFALDGKRLADVTTVSRIYRDNENQVGGYQRPEVLRHVRAIRAYLEAPGALMPNALVVAFDSRVKFEPAVGSERTADSAVGTLTLPLAGANEEKPGWVVDGQQRSAALRDAAIDRFPVPVVGFITDDLAEQRAQFILVNNTKPLPKGLIHELLPSIDGALPAVLARKRYPAKLVEALNYTPGSPMEGAIRTPTMPGGRIKDNSVLKMLEGSITDGALYRFRDPATGEGDAGKMLETLWNFWLAVKRTWPAAWDSSPRKSRLVHGVGIVSMGFVMDDIVDRFTHGGLVPSLDVCERELRRLVDLCAWTEGYWDFGLGQRRRWDDLQNTPKDTSLLADHLVRAYRIAADESGPKPEPSTEEQRLQATG